jgi:anti-sigma-K factor RskA
MRTNRPEPHTLAGAYVLDALDRRNAARFERHLARCQECTGEVSGLREATARLAAAAAVGPPASLKERLLAETARTRQLPPLARDFPAEPEGGERAGSRHRGRAGSRHRGRAGSWHAGLRRPAWAGVALGLAGLLLLATAGLWVIGKAGQQAPHSSAFAQVLTAPDATVISGQVRTGGTATVVMSHRERMLVFAAAGLRALPASRCYELWLVGPGRDVPAGLLPMPRHGMTGPVIASGLRSGYRLGLSVEPAAGSGHPTSAMILVLTL